MANRLIEIPVNNNPIVTSRSLDGNHPANKNLYHTSLEFEDLLKEVKIRFDTNPKFYQREDYLKLIELIRKNKGGDCNIDINVTGEGDIVSDITADGNTLNITKILDAPSSKYPKVRWARKGFIDLTNCKDIDYIIIPCTSKQLCLYITNDYLKSLRHVETYESIYGEEFDRNVYDEILLPPDFLLVVSKYFDNYKWSGDSGYYNLPRILNNLTEFLLPADCESEYFINCKEFCKVRKAKKDRKAPAYHYTPTDPLKVMFYRKDVHNGFIQFPYFQIDLESSTLYDYCLLDKFIFTPYMVFANPFNSTLGGAIPVKDGKLLIDLAFRLKNKTVELVSTGELIHFDKDGICETQLNPNTYIYLTMKQSTMRSQRKRKSINEYNQPIIRRQSCCKVRQRIRMFTGMVKVRRSLRYLTLKYTRQIPMIISRRMYTSLLNKFLFSVINVIRNNKTVQKLLCVGNNYSLNITFTRRPRAGYVWINPKGNSLLNSIVRYHVALYDRINMYTINKYSKITRIIHYNQRI